MRGKYKVALPPPLSNLPRYSEFRVRLFRRFTQNFPRFNIFFNKKFPHLLIMLIFGIFWGKSFAKFKGMKIFHFFLVHFAFSSHIFAGYVGCPKNVSYFAGDWHFTLSRKKFLLVFRRVCHVVLSFFPPIFPVTGSMWFS